MSEKEESLTAALDQIVSEAKGTLTYDRLSSIDLERELSSRVPRSPNPIIRFWETTEEGRIPHIAFTLLVDGERRVATRASALAGTIVSAEGELLSSNPFLLVFDYVRPRILAISAARLFWNFLEESKRRILPSAASSSFALTPSFANKTISMYHVNTPPDVWSIDLKDHKSAVSNLREGLSRVRIDTDGLPDRSEIVTAIQARLAGSTSTREPGKPYHGPEQETSVSTKSTLSLTLRPRAPFREELNSVGEASGVEVDETTDGQSVREPFDPDEIEVQTRQITIDLLLSRLRHRAIDLDPEFQRRRGIWDDQRQSRLIESILLKIPLPTMYAAEDAEENWAIVDGIQRMTAIARFASHEAISEKPLLLTGLEYLSSAFEGISFESLDTRLRRRLLETELVLHVIRHGTPDAVKDNIFARINTGGIPLSRQELRHALIPGKSRLLLKKWAESSAFIRATDNSISPDRMNDRELVLRFVAFKLNPPLRYAARDFNGFLGDAMRQINSLSEQDIFYLEESFFDALELALSIFGVNAFRKLYDVNAVQRYPINKALFEVVTVTLSSLGRDEKLWASNHREIIVGRFVDLMKNRQFEESISQGTGDIRKVRTRFSLFEQMLDGI